MHGMRKTTPDRTRQVLAWGTTKHAAATAVAADVADVVEVLDAEPGLSAAGRVHLSAILERAREIPSGIPVSATATLLGISDQSVRTWIERGVLDVVEGARPVQVTPRSLGEALASVASIRDTGRDARLLTSVLDTIADRRDRLELAPRIDELADREEFDPNDLEAVFG